MISGTGVLNKSLAASEGALMRRGTGFNLFNTVISQDRAKECIEIDGDATFTEVAVGATGAVTGQTDTGKAVNVVLNCYNKTLADDDTDSDSPSVPVAFNDTDIIDWFDAGANNVRANLDLGFDASNAATVPAGTDVQDAALSLTTAMGGTLVDMFVETNYIGAFPQDSTNNWTAGWTINVNGNVTVWEPATGGTLAGATPAGDGACPTGTTFIETVSLPNTSGTMDVCQLQRRYDGSDF